MTTVSEILFSKEMLAVRERVTPGPGYHDDCRVAIDVNLVGE